MVLEAKNVGLRVKELRRQPSSYAKIHFNESLTHGWHLFEFYPWLRLSYKGWGSKKETTRMPHRGAGRKIREGQMIHCSLLLGQNYANPTDTTNAETATTEATYKPKARFPEEWLASEQRVAEGRGDEPFDSADLISDLMAERCQWLSVDVDYIRARVKHATQPEDVIKSLERLDSGDVIIESERAMVQTMYNQVIYAIAMEQFKNDSDAKYSILERGMALLSDKDTSRLKLVKSSQVRRDLEGLSKDESKSLLEEKFIAKFTDPFILHKMTGNDWHQVRSVAVSLDGKIVSGYSDEKIRVWNAGEGLEELKGDKTVNTWDATTKEHWYSRRPEEHKETVISVAISPDGKRVVSATRDKTIRIWDTETGGTADNDKRARCRAVGCNLA
ncbi:hypothetical protein H1R20_g3135, partial [Candolleomyces eurysporus]